MMQLLGGEVGREEGEEREGVGVRGEWERNGCGGRKEEMD